MTRSRSRSVLWRLVPVAALLLAAGAAHATPPDLTQHGIGLRYAPYSDVANSQPEETLFLDTKTGVGTYNGRLAQYYSDPGTPVTVTITEPYAGSFHMHVATGAGLFSQSWDGALSANNGGALTDFFTGTRTFTGYHFVGGRLQFYTGTQPFAGEGAYVTIIP